MVLEKIAVLKELTIFSVLLRTVLAMVFSGILGYEREKKGRPAGFRMPVWDWHLVPASTPEQLSALQPSGVL